VAKSALVLHSGGQDSTTCLFWALRNFDQVYAMGFDYAQRHLVELECAQKLCERLKVPYTTVDMSFIAALGENSLTNHNQSFEMVGPYQGLPSSFVPGRNLFFLSAAAAFAAPRGIVDLVTGVCETDYSGYPDCRQDFVNHLAGTLELALQMKMTIHTPLMKLNKAQTFELAEKMDCLESVIKESHTCYQGDRSELHNWGYGCGSCPSCELRKKGYGEFIKGRGL